MANIINANQQFFDNNGNPLNGGLLYSYEITSTTPKSLYTTSAATTALSNPVVLDAYGRKSAGIFGTGLYRLILKTSAGVTLWDVDNVSMSNTIELNRENLLYNPDFAITQRMGNGSLALSDDQYGPDRWYLLTSGGSPTLDTDAWSLAYAWGTLGNLSFIEISPGASLRFGLAQIVPTKKAVSTIGRTVTYTGIVGSPSAATTINAAILAWTGTADTVTSDIVNDWTNASLTTGNFFNALNLSVVGTTSVATATTGPASGKSTYTAQYTVTGTVPASTTNLIVMFWTNDAFGTSIVGTAKQLVIGSDVNLFSAPEYQTELRKCLPFYEKSFPPATAPAQNAGTTDAITQPQLVAASTAGRLPFYPYKSHKYGTVSLTLYNPSAANAQLRNTTGGTDWSGTALVQTTHGFAVTGTSPGGSAATDQTLYHFTASSEL